jgi:hypothetical protein
LVVEQTPRPLGEYISALSLLAKADKFDLEACPVSQVKRVIVLDMAY